LSIAFVVIEKHSRPSQVKHPTTSAQM